MRKTGWIATITAGIVILGGGGYALGTMSNDRAEPVAVETPAAEQTPEVEAAPTAEMTPAPTQGPTDEFLTTVTQRVDQRGLSYSPEQLETAGQDVCAYVAAGEDVEPYHTVDSAIDIDRDIYMDIWDAALFTDGYCDQP